MRKDKHSHPTFLTRRCLAPKVGKIWRSTSSGSDVSVENSNGDDRARKTKRDTTPHVLWTNANTLAIVSSMVAVVVPARRLLPQFCRTEKAARTSAPLDPNYIGNSPSRTIKRVKHGCVVGEGVVEFEAPFVDESKLSSKH